MDTDFGLFSVFPVLGSQCSRAISSRLRNRACLSVANRGGTFLLIISNYVTSLILVLVSNLSSQLSRGPRIRMKIRSYQTHSSYYYINGGKVDLIL